MPVVCRYFCGACGFKTLKVWTKSFRMVSSGALCDKTSLLWFSAKFSDFEWKSSIFETWKFWRNFFIFTKNLQEPIRAAFWLTELLRTSLEISIKSRNLKNHDYCWHNYMMCLMCAVAPMSFVALKTRKYRPKAFQRRR